MLSSVTTFFRKTPQIFGYSAYLEECLASILDTNEQANDRLAVALVRLQRISERIHQSPWHDKNRPPTISNETLFMFNTLRDDLKTFYDNLPDSLQNNGGSQIDHSHILANNESYSSNELSCSTDSTLRYRTMQPTTTNYSGQRSRISTS